ncbi:MAG TPA: aminotransferase class III-fold pyridoxal phosphate-dependent enzyme [Thermoleophilaceae bacterium]|nr:aminotransferase class III-fold pyridoxal phosphate-dependent enzyme [Thermoleophilaceae bacterium]
MGPSALAAGATLNTRQRAHVEALVADYSARTAGSKRIAAETKPYHADHRASLFFRPDLKEIVYPIYGARSLGPHIWDVDGNRYVDIAMDFGACLFGHRPGFVRDALAEQAEEGLALCPTSSKSGPAAEILCRLTGMERAAFLNDGTEAVMSALRLARTHTGRSRVVLFTRGFHGWYDQVLAPLTGRNRAAQPPLGVAPEFLSEVTVLEYGTDAAIEQLSEIAGEVAAVLVEPLQGRDPAVRPVEFLRELRRITHEAGAVLIFDEILTGFRVHPGGCQALFGIRADLTTYGKLLGGGLPIGVLAGSAEHMAPVDGGIWRFGDGSVPQTPKTDFGGTFFKNPMTMAAVLVILRELERRGPGLQEGLDRRTGRLLERLNGVFEDAGVPIRAHGFSSLFQLEHDPALEHAGLLTYELVRRGVYLWHGMNYFLSDAHGDEEEEFLVASFADAVDALQRAELLPR